MPLTDEEIRYLDRHVIRCKHCGHLAMFHVYSGSRTDCHICGRSCVNREATA